MKGNKLMSSLFENINKNDLNLNQIAKVENFKSNRSGNPIANQFRITLQNGTEIFQSYNSIVAVKVNGLTFLDRTCWDFSNTTSRYRKEFLNEDTKTTKQKIKDDVYVLMNLN